MVSKKKFPTHLFDGEKLRQWFFLNRRILPWRENPSPYEVWVSEVMLQQTRVSVVIPYYAKWMQQFPTISSLARAPLDNVIKVWEGLGYYSRARNLKKGAEYVTEEHEGELPSTYSELSKVNGLGPYTIGAILSFAFNKRAPAVDGNVLRVLARFFAIEDPIDKGKTQKEIRELCASLLPPFEPWVVMEGLIELGALICQKKAQCDKCPLSENCLGKSKCHLLPIKSERAEAIHLHRDVAVIIADKELLLQRGQTGKVMADLWEFPYFDRGVDVEQALGIPLQSKRPLQQTHHGFTKYKAFLYPHLYEGKKLPHPTYHWVPFPKLSHIPFSAGHRKILYQLRQELNLEL